MTSIAKLKDRARKHEQKEDWQAAIKAYQQVLEKEEGADDFDLELGLYNRIGDLYLRLGQTDQAVSYYETAADMYAAAGFTNNAIALCNKALRHRPNQPEIYLKLSRLCAEQGFQTDARRWILEFAERQMRAGRVEEALTGLDDFAALSDDPEIRAALADQLVAHDRNEEAVEQLRHAYRLYTEQDDPAAAADVAERAQAIDPAVDLASEMPPVEPQSATAEPGAEPAPTEGEGEGGVTGLEGLETRREELSGGEPAGLEGLERTLTGADADEDADTLSGLERSGQAPVVPPEEVDAEGVGGLETFDAGASETAEEEVVDEAAGAGVEPVPDAGYEPELDEEEPEPLPLIDTGYDEEAGEEPEPLPLIDTGYEDMEDPAEEEPEERVAEVEEEVEEPVAEAEGVEEEVEEPVATVEEPVADAEEEVEEQVAPVEEPVAEVEEVEEVVEEEVEQPVAEVEKVEEEVEQPVAEVEEAFGASEEEVAEPVAAEEVAAVEDAQEEVAEPVAEAETAEEEEVHEPLDLSLEGVTGMTWGVGQEERDELDAEHAAEAMDLDVGSFDLGAGSGEDGPPEDLDVEAVLQRGRELVSRGLTDEALRELRLLSGAEEDPELFRHALAIVNEIVRHDANDISALQRRVEYAARTSDRQLLVDAYTDLGDALARLGAETKAQAMYERVLALDPESDVAREALGGTAEEDEDTIDLDAILREVGSEELEAGMSNEAAESDPSFAAMLSQFKAKVTDNAESNDAGDHYDLGLAFKEMGLIDEAIAEFQTALTGGTERLKVYEELGQCFMQKNQYTVALKVLNRALKVPHKSTSELLGVYYHLGQCHEQLGQRAEAREAYQKVLEIDDSFADVPDRVARL